MNGIIREYSTNNINTQININGWKEVFSKYGVTIIINKQLNLAEFRINKTVASIAAKTVYNILDTDSAIPTVYRPYTSIHMNDRQDAELWIGTDGRVHYYCSVALTNKTIYAVCVYNLPQG